MESLRLTHGWTHQSHRAWQRRRSDGSSLCVDYGGSCDERSRLSSSSTTGEPICALPKRGRAARRRCGGGSGCPVTPSATRHSRSSRENRATRWRSASLRGMHPCSSGARRRPSPPRPGGSAASKQPPAAAAPLPSDFRPAVVALLRASIHCSLRGNCTERARTLRGFLRVKLGSARSGPNEFGNGTPAEHRCLGEPLQAGSELKMNRRGRGGTQR